MLHEILKATRINPYRYLGVACNIVNRKSREKGKFNAASYLYVIPFLNKALEINPEDAGLYFNRGIAHIDNGDTDHAMADYVRAIELEPGFAEAYNNRSLIYRDSGMFDLSLQDCDKTIELRPDNTELQFSRGIVYAAKGDWERAAADFDIAKNRGMSPAYLFHAEYESTSAFEREFEVSMPAHIAELLTAEK